MNVTLRSWLVLGLIILTLNVYAKENNPSSVNYEIGRGSRTSWARAKLQVKNNSSRIRNWDWFIHPSGDIKFIYQLSKNTTVNMAQEWNVVSLKKLNHMVAFPMIFLTSEHVVDLTMQEQNNLKEYILRGGLILVDDCVWYGRNTFYVSMCKLLKKLFPTVSLISYKKNHNILSYFYKFNRWPHMQGVNTGVTLAYYQNRLIAVLTGSDLHCGWVGAGWFHPYPQKRNMAYKMGINVYLYMMNN